MTRKDPGVDAFLAEAKQWREEFERLRTVLLDTPLTEELKWGKPCYTFQGGNVVIIQGFKGYCALMFFKGALLEDPEGILVRTGPNTRVGRQVRFTDAGEIGRLEPVLRAYVDEAVEVERAGLKVAPRKETELAVPEEFQDRLDGDPALRTAFDGLTPGRRREYVYYFSEPKRSETRVSRVDRSRQRILEGRGLRDR